MDGADRSFSSSEIAELLGTSIPRIHRALVSLAINPSRGPKGHLVFSSQQVRALTEHLGAAPNNTGFSREELFVLHALYHHPMGLRSARSVAAWASVSTTTASRILTDMQTKGLIERRTCRVAEGRAVDVDVWRLRVRPYWLTPDLLVALAGTNPPAIRPGPSPAHVPLRLSHLFWNAPAEKWRMPEYSGAIATTILEHNDIAALSWAAQALPAETFHRVARQRRGVTSRARRLAANIAKAKERCPIP